MKEIGADADLAMKEAILYSMRRLLIYLFAFLTVVSLIITPLSVGSSESVRTSLMLATVISILITLYNGYITGLLALVILIFFIGQVLHPTEKPFSFQQATVFTMAEYFVQGVIINFFVYILQRAHAIERQNRKKFQSILSSIGEAVVATDSHGRVTYMNAKAQKLTGWHYRDARKMPIDKVITFVDKAVTGTFEQTVCKAMQEGKRLNFSESAQLLSKDMRTVMIDDSIAPLRDSKGEVIGAVIIFDDISEHKQQDERFELLMSSVSHELKNYITSIQGYSLILEKKLEKTTLKELTAYSKKLSNKIQTMRSMIAGMFDLSKLKMGKLDMHRKEFDLSNLIQSIIQDTELDKHDRIKLISDQHITVFADPVRIGQVMTNLLTNAVKYSDPETVITVKVSVVADVVIVVVEDQGKGIPKEKIEMVFRPFYRALDEEARTSISGSGLGLYISREIVRQHGGRMWAESQEGVGSTFYFTLPFEQSEEILESNDSEAGLLTRIREILSVQE